MILFRNAEKPQSRKPLIIRQPWCIPSSIWVGRRGRKGTDKNIKKHFLKDLAAGYAICIGKNVHSTHDVRGLYCLYEAKGLLPSKKGKVFVEDWELRPVLNHLNLFQEEFKNREEKWLDLSFFKFSFISSLYLFIKFRKQSRHIWSSLLSVFFVKASVFFVVTSLRAEEERVFNSDSGVTQLWCSVFFIFLWNVINIFVLYLPLKLYSTNWVAKP